MCEIDVEHEEGARKKLSALLMTKRIRINKRCEQLRTVRIVQEVDAVAIFPDDADPLRLFAKKVSVIGGSHENWLRRECC